MLLGKAFDQFRKRRLANLLYLVAHADTGLVDVDVAREINWRCNQHDVAGDAPDGLLQFVPLGLAIAHSWQDLAKMRKGFEGSLDRPHSERSRIDELVG